MYNLTSEEKKRLVAGIRAVFTIPFIDDVEDFIWEAIWQNFKANFNVCSHTLHYQLMLSQAQK